MFTLNRRYLSYIRIQGYTILELLIVITIVSILCSISIPSFLNYINYLRLRTFRNDVINDINYLISASQKYGGNCNIQFNQLRLQANSNNRFAASLQCFQNSSQLRFNNQATKLIQLESDDLYLLTNTASVQIGNHGAVVGSGDYLFVLGFRSSVGADSKPVCFTLKRYNSSIMTGTYSRNVNSSSGSYISKIVTSLNPSYCI